MSESENLDPVPAEFTASRRRSGLFRLLGPLFTRVEDRGVVVSLRIDERHLNSRGMLHGGLIAATGRRYRGQSRVRVQAAVLAATYPDRVTAFEAVLIKDGAQVVHPVFDWRKR